MNVDYWYEIKGYDDNHHPVSEQFEDYFDCFCQYLNFQKRCSNLRIIRFIKVDGVVKPMVIHRWFKRYGEIKNELFKI